jgi:hypothetical protein
MASWAYDAAIRSIADELPDTPEGRDLKDWLLLQTCEHCGSGLGRVDVRELAPDDCASFEAAVLQAVVTSGERGPVGWSDVSFFPKWHERFKDLARLIGSIHAGESPEQFNPLMLDPRKPTGRQVGPGWDRINRRNRPSS